MCHSAVFFLGSDSGLVLTDNDIILDCHLVGSFFTLHQETVPNTKGQRDPLHTPSLPFRAMWSVMPCIVMS